MKKTLLVALCIAVTSLLPNDSRAADKSSVVKLTRVTAERIVPQIALAGVTDYKKRASVTTKYSDKRVLQVIAEEGAYVKKGDPIVALDPETLTQQLSEAESLRNARRKEYDALAKLKRTGDAPRLDVLRAEAAWRESESKLANLRQNMEDLTVSAPFDGYLDRIRVKTGEMPATHNNVVATIFAPDSLIVSAAISERYADRVLPGLPASAILPNGKSYDAVISYVAKDADVATRTFTVEAKIKLPENAEKDAAPVAAGLTAAVTLSTKAVTAHRIPPSALSLSDDGAVGVKIRDDSGKASFVALPVGGAADGEDLLLYDLPKDIELVSAGHFYVADGEDLSALNLSKP